MGRKIVGNNEKTVTRFAMKENFDVENPLMSHGVAVGGSQGGVAMDLRADKAAAFKLLKIVRREEGNRGPCVKE